MSYKTQRGNAAKKSPRFHATIIKTSDYQQVTYYPVAASRQTNLLLLIRGEELVLEKNHFERFKNRYLIKSLAFRRKHYTFADEQEPKI